MKTKLAEMAEQLSLLDRGDLAYAPNDNEEIEILEEALRDLSKVDSETARLRGLFEERLISFRTMKGAAR